MEQFSKYVGLDVHKETIAVSVADVGRSKARFVCTVMNNSAAVSKPLKKLSPNGEALSVCDEAGRCGYGLYRQISSTGHDGEVMAASLIPQRAGELTPVWVPDETQEAIRDLVRARDDFRGLERQQRQKLLAFLLRYGKHWTGGKSNWTKGFWPWLESVRLSHEVQQYVLREYMDGVQRTTQQILEIEKEMERAKKGWALEPIVDALMAMRGIRLVAAMGIIAELGDLSRLMLPLPCTAHTGD